MEKRSISDFVKGVFDEISKGASVIGTPDCSNTCIAGASDSKLKSRRGVSPFPRRNCCPGRRPATATISLTRPFNFGLLACIFLTLHATFLGVDLNSNLFDKIRRLIIVLFILFEVLAQISLTRNFLKFKKDLKNYINPLIVNIKVAFVATIFFVSFIVFTLLVWGDLSGSTKHILEWNYFSLLLVYYFLSRLLWKTH